MQWPRNAIYATYCIWTKVLVYQCVTVDILENGVRLSFSNSQIRSGSVATHRYRIETVLMTSGERLPMLIRPDGQPHFEATVFSLQELRARNLASNTTLVREVDIGRELQDKMSS